MGISDSRFTGLGFSGLKFTISSTPPENPVFRPAKRVDTLRFLALKFRIWGQGAEGLVLFRIQGKVCGLGFWVNVNS